MPPLPVERSAGDIRFVINADRTSDSFATSGPLTLAGTLPHLTGVQVAAGWAQIGGSSDVTIFGAVAARGSIKSGNLIGQNVGGTIAVPINPIQVSPNGAAVAESRPIERWKLIARTNTTDFVFAAASIIVAFVALLFALKDVMPHIRAALSMSALAASQRALDAASAFNIDTAFVALFAMMLVWSVAAMTFSKTPRIYKAAADTNKTLLGVLLGYFGGKAR